MVRRRLPAAFVAMKEGCSPGNSATLRNTDAEPLVEWSKWRFPRQGRTRWRALPVEWFRIEGATRTLGGARRRELPVEWGSAAGRVGVI